MSDRKLADRLREAVQRREAAGRFDWDRMARSTQRLPAGSWRNWLILAGRGWGKTLTGAQTCRIWSRDFPYIALVGATIEDARDIMVEGPSGILSVCPNHERPAYYPAKHSLEWPNGCKMSVFTASEPERLRGKQFCKLWADELASWPYLRETWDQCAFGLRLGKNPQAVITTTPKPLNLLRSLLHNRTTHVTRGSTYENRDNLAEQFFSEIINRFEGTRLGKQELNAEILSDNPGALWTLAGIEADRVTKVPDLERVVVAIDPSGTSTEASDECGIVVTGRDGQRKPHFYVLADLSLRGSPETWARKAILAYHAHGADRVIAEGNFGGDMVESVLRNIDPNVSFKKVTASRGKLIRAEPVAALYEQHRVHHVGVFEALEEQMVNYVPGSPGSPDRMDAGVWAISGLMEDSNPFFGWLKRWKSDKGEAEAMEEIAPGVTLGAPQTLIAPGTITVNSPRTDHMGNPLSAAEAARRGGIVSTQTPMPAAFRFEDPRGVLSRSAFRHR
jgi:phage terminase large subunit-like protein